MSCVLTLPPPIGELTLEVHRCLESVAADWLAFESRADGHPYQGYQWLSAWHSRIRAGNSQPFIALLRDRSRIRMLLPLALERHLGMSRLVPMGTPVCDYHGPLIDPQFARQLAPEITRRVLMEIVSLAGADYALLTHIPPLLGATPNPFAALATRPCGANAHGLALGAEWEAFYAGRRSAKTRGRFRGKERALAQSGPIVFSEITDAHQRAALAAEMMALKAAQLKATAGLFNTFARPSVQDFFRALACEADGDVLVFRLTAGGRLVAAALGVVRQGCFYYQVPVYPDDALQRHSPGHILLTRLMQWAIAHGCTRFDFTIGDEPYKAEWCDQTWVLGCGTWARTLRGRVGANIALAQIAAMRVVKGRRVLYGLAVRIRTALGRVRQALGTVHD